MGWAGQESDYTVWKRFAEMTGDSAMVARLNAIELAEKAGCETTMALPDGSRTSVPLMIAAEAAVAAHKGEDEAKWRHEWTRTLVGLAVKWQDEVTTQGVVAVLSNTDAVIHSLRKAGVWPWAAPAEAPE
jgi:hypothetical protein